MAEITAAAVKVLRERTGLPMMECKKALQETGGDEDAAVDWLRKQGIKTKETRLGRETSAGPDRGVCRLRGRQGGHDRTEVRKLRRWPVSAEFRDFATDLAKQLALGPGAKTPEELLLQPSPSRKGVTLGEVKDDMFNRIREVFNLTRIERIVGHCGAYAHHDGSSGALVEVSGGNAEAAKDIALHVTAIRPQVVSKEDLPAEEVAREREILSAAARQEGKPENIIAKMIEGRLKVFFSERVLLEQPFVKDDKQTVGKIAEQRK